MGYSPIPLGVVTGKPPVARASFDERIRPVTRLSRPKGVPNASKADTVRRYPPPVDSSSPLLAGKWLHNNGLHLQCTGCGDARPRRVHAPTDYDALTSRLRVRARIARKWTRPRFELAHVSHAGAGSRPRPGFRPRLAAEPRLRALSQASRDSIRRRCTHAPAAAAKNGFSDDNRTLISDASPIRTR